MKKILLLFYIFHVVLNSFSQTIIVYNTENSELPDIDVNAIIVDENNNKWFGTGSGLAFFDGLNWKIYDASTDINISEYDNTVNDLFIKNSDLWIATNDGAAVANYDESGLTSSIIYNYRNSDIADDTVTDISIDGTESVWMGSLNMLSTLLNNIWHIIDDNLIFDLYDISTIASTNDTLNFVGTYGGGVFLMYNDEVDGITSATRYQTPWSQFPSDSINTIYIDDTTQWYGTDKGVGFHKGLKAKENWIQYYKEDGLLSNVVYVINKDQTGRFWFGTNEGISILDNENWSSYTVEDGLSSNHINDIAFQANGNVWLATDNGVTKLQYIDDTPVSIKTTTEEFINIYPNPTNGILNIHNKSNNLIQRIELYDINGNKLFSQSINSIQICINLETYNLYEGIYILKAITRESSMNKIVVYKK